MNKDSKTITKNLNLTYQLLSYFLKHPETEDRYKADTYVFFSKTDENLNKFNYHLLTKTLQTDKKVILVFFEEKNNKWNFQYATRNNIPRIPYISD